MSTAVVSLTKNGAKLALEIGQKLQADTYIKEEFMEQYVPNENPLRVIPIAENFASLVKKIFHSHDALVFVMACGIVVRSIAPYIKDKSTDPAVVVVDEKGKHAISLLSGHLGGANRLAVQVAAVTGGTPVITTATDVNQVTAFDLFAVENDCAIENLKELKYISGALVNGEKVALHTDCSMEGAIPENIVPEESGLSCGVLLTNSTEQQAEEKHVLKLRPRNLILGIGCRKGVTAEAIEEAVEDFLQKNGKSILSVKYLASIELKKDEQGIRAFCEKRQIPFVTLTAQKLQQVEDRCSTSHFVKQTVGVGSVSEACAIAAEEEARLLCGKTVYKGITLALAQIGRTYRFY